MSKIGTVTRITKADATTPIPVASDATVYTPHFNLYGGEAFGVTLLAASDGDVNLKIELEEGMSIPTLEAADTNCVEPEGFPDIAVIEDELAHIVQITPVPAKYGRFKITGQSTNHATTTLRIDLFVQEDTSR